MTLRELVTRLLESVHPDQIRWSQFDDWFRRMENRELIVGDPISRDIYHFAKKLLAEYDLVKK